ncbi:MAG: hypothetical protein AUI36_09935 [Cyanobacteria bacterium 13_1_40CM_2_61_4]|nr:MAG: hypothetical protein AUI36_09935 [Cyanobacteria bacterium 13_1_40CM_2_61_4]
MDMDSFQVDARKWGITKSFTPLLKPYIKGTTLQAREVKIPEVRFLIHIEIADVNGAKTDETYRFEVRGH